MDKLRQLLHGLHLIGLPNALRALRYTLRRDRLNARYAPPVESGPTKSPGKLLAAEPAVNGAHFRFESAELTIRFLMPDFVFVAWDGAAMSPSYAVVHGDWPDVEIALAQAGNGWRVQSQALALQVASDGTLLFFDRSGTAIRREEPPRRCAQGWLQRAQLAPEGRVYGLGERAAPLDLRPGTYRLWNTDAGGSYGPGCDPLYICMPVYVCVQAGSSHLVFYDNTFAGRVTLNGGVEVEFQDGPLRYYVAVGPPPALLKRLTQLTGRAPLPPRWALGYHQSQWGYRTEAEMRCIFDGFRRHALPLSGLFLDADHFRGYRTLTLDESRYPTLAEFARELQAHDVHLIAIVDPGVKQERGFDLYEQGLARDAFCEAPDGRPMIGVVWPGWTAFPDFTSPRARAWWGEQYTRHLRYGIDGFWHDMNEPSAFVASGDPTLPLCTRHDLEGRGGDHREAHNVYGLLMNRAGYEALRRLRPDRRPFILSRSGWVGMQRYAWTWTGDVETSWPALRQTIATVLGLGLSGQPYAGPDVGGFSGSPSPELFVRWFQLGAFLPFFRTHSAFYLPRREPWEFGPEVLNILRAHLLLRYRLLPYWYTLAWQASQTGEPLVRPLFWDEPQEQVLWEVDDAFLVGDALLVAPVVEGGARERTVRLPRGGWYELDSDRLHTGACEVRLAAPLERIPVLVRAGSVLPMQEDGNLVLHVYRPAAEESGGGTLYSDTGDGYGDRRLDHFRLQPVSGGYEFGWTAEGNFAWPYDTTLLHLHGFDCDHVIVQGQSAVLRDGRCETRPLASVLIPCNRSVRM